MLIFLLYKVSQDLKNEIVIYQDDEASTHIEVRIEDETVWLSQTLMVELFRSTRQNISLHHNNIFSEGELVFDSTVKEYLTVQKEGNTVVERNLSLYYFDVIISVGYRVKIKMWHAVLDMEIVLPPEKTGQAAFRKSSSAEKPEGHG